MATSLSKKAIYKVLYSRESLFIRFTFHKIILLYTRGLLFIIKKGSLFITVYFSSNMDHNKKKGVAIHNTMYFSSNMDHNKKRVAIHNTMYFSSNMDHNLKKGLLFTQCDFSSNMDSFARKSVCIDKA